ncbi:MAG TPA: energy-coupling factor transporter ATPase [Firmicutes bacterium]|nr:energy-coupling factor transporter ATPase [Bacillota bacterium]
MPLIETKDLSYVYSEGTPYEKRALNGVSINIEEGKITAVIGHTGSGKSTLMQQLNGLIKPTGGKIYFDGRDIWENPKEIRQLRFKVGLVFQYPEYQLFDETVGGDIAFGPKNMGLDEKEITRRVRFASEMVSLDENLLNKSPFELSGGEKRRAAIAGVIAMMPRVIVLDEPTAGLDPRGRDEILSRLLEYKKMTDTTMVIVSHSMEDVAYMADSVLVMNRGSLMMHGSVSEVFSRADELKSVGLNVPDVTKIFMGLKSAGVRIRDDIFTVKDGADEIKRYIEAKVR